MEASGFEEVRDPGVTPLVGPYLSLRGLWRPSPWFALDLSILGGAGLVRDRFNVVNVDNTRQTLFRSKAVHGSMELGARFQLPL